MDFLFGVVWYAMYDGVVSEQTLKSESYSNDVRKNERISEEEISEDN